MPVSAKAITLGRCRGKGTGPVIGSGGGKASASFAESGVADSGCCGAKDGGSGKTLGAGAAGGAAWTVSAVGDGGGAPDGVGARAATCTFGAPVLPPLSRIRSPLASSVALASVADCAGCDDAAGLAVSAAGLAGGAAAVAAASGCGAGTVGWAM